VTEHLGESKDGELVGVPDKVKLTVAIIADSVFELAVYVAQVVRFMLAKGEVPSWAMIKNLIEANPAHPWGRTNVTLEDVIIAGCT
jgi:hypothetical protein